MVAIFLWWVGSGRLGMSLSWCVCVGMGVELEDKIYNSRLITMIAA